MGRNAIYRKEEHGPIICCRLQSHELHNAHFPIKLTHRDEKSAEGLGVLVKREGKMVSTRLLRANVFTVSP